MVRHTQPRLFLLLTFLILTSSCTMVQRERLETPQADRTHTFTAAFASLPRSIAPYGRRSWHKAQILPLLYNGLIALDERLEPLPALASRWEVSADGRVYTMHLRRGVTFHHGKELEADDVRYSFQQAASADMREPHDQIPFAIIATVQTLDRHTVRFLLKEPYAPFLSKLTVTYFPIIPRQAIGTSQLIPPGTGPFQLVDVQPGQRIVLKKFAAYWETNLPRVDTVVLLGIQDAAVRLRLLHQQEIDYVLLEPLYERVPFVDTSTDVVWVDSAPTGTFSVIFNIRKKPFDDVRVRQAFAWAIDKAMLTQRVLGEYGVPVNQPFNPAGSPWYADVEDRGKDILKTRELLTAAGYPEGINVRLPAVAEAALFGKMALALEEQLRQAGIRLRVEVMPVQRVLNIMQRGEWNLLLRGEVSQLDPDDVYFSSFHSSGAGRGNMSGYHTLRMDALLNAGRHTLESKRRLQTYRQVVSLLQEDVPELYLFMVRWPVAWHRRVQGYDGDLLRCCLVQVLSAIGNQGFKTIWLEK